MLFADLHAAVFLQAMCQQTPHDEWLGPEWLRHGYRCVEDVPGFVSGFAQQVRVGPPEEDIGLAEPRWTWSLWSVRPVQDDWGAAISDLDRAL